MDIFRQFIFARPASKGLTGRELAVLMAYGRGQRDGESADATAARLGMATRTYQRHLENARRKMAVPSTAGAYLKAQDQNLINVQPEVAA